VSRSEVKPRVLVDRASRGRFDYDAGVSRLGSILLLGLAACASSVPRSVPRVVDGRVENGPAVSPYAYEWFIEGELQAAKGRHEEAAMAFENATAAPVADVVLITRLAEEYEITGAVRRADRTLSSARRAYPDSARVSLTEGRILRSRGEIDAALVAFGRAAEQAPRWADPVVAVAETLASRGDTERAAEVLVEYLEGVSPEHAESARTALVTLARSTGSAATLRRALAFEPGSSAQEQAYQAAELAMSIGQPTLAARLLEDALTTRDNAVLWLHALEESGERAQAARYLASAKAARLARVEDRTALLLDLHEEERALRLLAAAERSAEVQYARGRAFLARGDYLQAASTLAKVPLGAAPFERARIALAECWLSRDRSGAAAEALSIAPHASLSVRNKLAEIYVDEGELRAALRLFDARRTSDRAALAGIYERAGRYEEAAAYYAAVPLSQSNEARIRARASAEQLASRGLRRSAIVVLEDWAAAAPADLFSRVRLVELLQEERRTEEARERGEKALELIDDPRLREHLVELLRAEPIAAAP
jgi:thioredoxin-like negative regulator of GroEL